MHLKKSLKTGPLGGLMMAAALAFAPAAFAGGESTPFAALLSQLREEPAPAPLPGFTPFTRIASIPAIRVNGAVDPVATYDYARDIALTIASFAANEDEAVWGIAQSNWVLGGAPEGPGVSMDAVSAAVLEIPSPFPIDPSQPVSAANTKKVSVMDMCNKTLASKALGVLPVVGETKVANGFVHAVALPCEIAVYADGDQVQVEMLNAEAIFTLFFTDVVFGEQMQDPAFAAEIRSLPAQVNAELPALVYAALGNAGISYSAQNEPLGPRYANEWDIVRAVAATPYNSPYIQYVYHKADGTVFTDAEATTIAQTIIDTMTINGQADAGIHAPDLDAMLSPGGLWRSARPAPLNLPGGNKVLEACSPKYAKMAMGTGLHHATALPCEISITRIDGGERILVSFLDPNFMFKALFRDAIEAMSEEERASFAELPQLVLADLQTIVQYAFDVNLPLAGIELENPGLFFYDMLPF